MIDNEIIKALGCCNHNHVWQRECFDCEYATFEGQCGNELIKDALDLINRQKAEISKLQSDQYAIDKFARDLCKERMLKGKAIADFEDLQDYIKKEKTEAIREFAERLKATYPPREDKKCTLDDCYTLDVIDNLVKEMTEGENKE